jgi:hypothetical protein
MIVAARVRGVGLVSKHICMATAAKVAMGRGNDTHHKTLAK